MRFPKDLQASLELLWAKETPALEIYFPPPVFSFVTHPALHEWVRVYQQEFPEEPLEYRIAYEVWLYYETVTDDYEKNIGCPWNEKYKTYMPATPSQRELAIQFARGQRRLLAHLAAGVPHKEQHEARKHAMRDHDRGIRSKYNNIAQLEAAIREIALVSEPDAYVNDPDVYDIQKGSATVEEATPRWTVEPRGDQWYIVHPIKKAKKIGPVRMRGTNYYDKAMEEAERRNNDK